MKMSDFTPRWENIRIQNNIYSQENIKYKIYKVALYLPKQKL